MSVKFAAIAAIALVFGSTARAADIVGAWTIHGSVFFNAVDTTCLFKAEGDGIAATCENDGKPGDYTPATVTGRKVSWSWNSGPAVLAFDGTPSLGHGDQGQDLGSRLHRIVHRHETVLTLRQNGAGPVRPFCGAVFLPN